MPELDTLSFSYGLGIGFVLYYVSGILCSYYRDLRKKENDQ